MQTQGQLSKPPELSDEMLLLFQPSPITVPLWAYLLTTAVLASGGIVGSWLGRKRSTTVKAEDDKLAAEARTFEIQSIRDLSREVRDMRADAVLMAEESRKRAEETRKQQEFAREQILWHETVTTLAREGAHAAINEIQRCVLAIHFRDEAIKQARDAIQCTEELLTDNKIKFTKAKLGEIPPFEPVKHKEIVKYQDFPLPPKPGAR